MGMPDEASSDGYNREVQINYLSHFLLAAELMPLLEKAAEVGQQARVVTHSSLLRAWPSRTLEAKYFERNGCGNLMMCEEMVVCV